MDERDQAETDAALKSLKDAIGQESLVVRQLAAKEADPTRQKELLDAIRTLEDLMAQLALVAKVALPSSTHFWGVRLSRLF